MLMLTRKPGQRLYIGDDITVVIFEYSKGQFKVGVDAPKEIAIVREEAKSDEPQHKEVS
jgi:carbon storage regulator